MEQQVHTETRKEGGKSPVRIICCEGLPHPHPHPHFSPSPQWTRILPCRWHQCSVQSHSVRQDSDICQKLAMFKRFMSKITSSGELSASASCSKWESVAGSRQVLEKNLVSYSYCVSDFYWKLNLVSSSRMERDDTLFTTQNDI